MSTSNTNMSCNWIILIFLHGILAVQSKKNSEDENKIQKKMTALIDTQSGHYENNYEYLFFVTELIVSRLSKKSISAKQSDIKKFQTYNNRRLYLEEQIDSRVDRVNFEMLSLPYGHTCKDFYMQQKSALENAYTKKNSIKQDILNENSKNCPSTNDSDGRNSYNNNNNEQNDNDNPKNDIIENIDAHINSALGHYQNNMEYNERLNDLYMAKQSEWRSSHIVLAVNKFHHYNTRRLELEKQIESRVRQIDFEMESLPQGHSCRNFYIHQKMTLERAYSMKNLAKENILDKTRKNCPFKYDSNAQWSGSNGGNRQGPGWKRGTRQRPGSNGGNRQRPGSNGGNRQWPGSNGGNRQWPDSNEGNRQWPGSNGGNRQWPGSNGGNRQWPDSNGGNRQWPGSNGGNRQWPDSNGGHRQWPGSNGGNRQWPDLNGGNRQWPGSNGGNRQWPRWHARPDW